MMKRKCLFLFGLVLLILIYYSCKDYGLDDPYNETTYPISFSVDNAREFFEKNATDLAPLSFATNIPGKSASVPSMRVEMSPDWGKAMISGHQGVTLIEIPLRSISAVHSREYVFHKHKVVWGYEAISGRRLIIAKRGDGEIDMFIVTIVPEIQGTEDDPTQMLRHFRYLGGGNFSGKVFCSTLDGKFVKALGYTGGELNGTLNTKVRNLTESSDIKEDTLYSLIQLCEVTVNVTRVFSPEENAQNQYCQHNFLYSECPFRCVKPEGELDVVEVVVCPYCGNSNGCFCPKCFYCGLKERECHCARCNNCHKKMPECTCLLYPDIDKPEVPDHGGGGSGGITGPENHPTPEADAIYSPNSTFSQAQKELLNQALSEFCEKCSQFKAMYDKLVELGVKMQFEINPKRLDEVKGLAGYIDGKMMFYNEEYIALNYLQEEMIHAVQANDVFGQPYMVTARKNVEFEAKVIQDIVTTMVGGGFIGGMGQTDQFGKNYVTWITSIDESSMEQFISRFLEFCEPWTGYKGTYDPDFSPETIKKYFK